MATATTTASRSTAAKKAAATKTAATKAAATKTATKTATKAKRTAETASAAAKTTARKAKQTRAAATSATKNSTAGTASTFTSNVNHVASGAVNAAQAASQKAAAAIKSIDLSAFDLDALKRLDPRTIDWSKMELPEVDGRKLLDAVRDAAYVTVGFGVMAIQKANVVRQEMAGRIADRFGVDSGQVEDLISSFESRIVSFDDAVQARVDTTVAKIGERLPTQAASLLNQAHGVAKSARTQVRALVLRSN